MMPRGPLLLTGATGAIGGAVLEAALREGRRVVAVSRQGRPEGVPAGVAWTTVDMTSPADLARVIRDAAPEAIVHAAGAASVPESWRDPARDYAGSVTLVHAVLEGVRRSATMPRLVIVGSAAVYGNPARQPVRESDPTRPISPYGWHRHLCEDLATLYRESYGLPIVVGRVFSAYGERLHRQVLHDAFVRLATAGESAVTFFGTGEETRDFLHVEDVATACLALARAGDEPVVNIASGTSVRLRDVISAIATRVGYRGAIGFDGVIRPGDPRFWDADVEALRRLGVVPAISLPEGLDRMWAARRPDASPRVVSAASPGASTSAATSAATSPRATPRVAPSRPRVALRLVGDPQWHGGVQYLQNLQAALLALPDAERPEVWLQADHRTRASLPCFLPLSPQVAGLAWVGDRMPPEVEALARAGRAVHFADGAALGAHFAAVYPVLSKAWPECPTAMSWIPDLQHRHLPELFSDTERAQRDAAFRDVTRRSRVCIVSSEAARRDLAAFDPGATARIEVLRFRTSLPYDPDPARVEATVAAYGITEPYLMCINQFWKHKDHPVLFEALAALHATGAAPLLVCTGALQDYRHPGYGDAVVAMVASLGLADRVRLLGHVPREDQAQLLRGASGVVQPSRFEGWSTVLEDARTLGLPVLASDFPVHLEQAPPGLETFTTGSSAHLAEALRRVWPRWRRPPAARREAELQAARDAEHAQREFARTFLRIAGLATDSGPLHVAGDFRTPADVRTTLGQLAHLLASGSAALGGRGAVTHVMLHGPGVEALPAAVFSSRVLRGGSMPPAGVVPLRLAS